MMSFKHLIGFENVKKLFTILYITMNDMGLCVTLDENNAIEKYVMRI
jgi:hypothetical protein